MRTKFSGTYLGYAKGFICSEGVCVGHEEDLGRKRPHFTVAALKGRRPASSQGS